MNFRDDIPNLIKHIRFFFKRHCRWVNNLETWHDEADELIFSPTYITYNIHTQFSCPVEEINFAPGLHGGIVELDYVFNISMSAMEDQALGGSADCRLL